MSERIYYYNTDASSGNPLELMDYPELARAAGSLAREMMQEQQELLANGSAAAETIESLAEEPVLWYTKAVLLSLENALDSLENELRDITLSHLFDMIFFGNRSVRSIAAQTAGKMIARFAERDMNVWSDFLRKALFMKKDDTLTGQRLTEDPLRITFLTVYHNVREDLRKPVLGAYASYFKSTRWDAWTCLRLISGIITIPVREWGAMQRGNIGGFVRYFLKKPDAEIRVASFYLLKEWLEQGWKPSEDFKGYLEQAIAYIYENEGQISPAENELIRIICSQTGISRDTYLAPADKVLYLNNLRSNHFWLYKLVNLQMLRDKYGDADKMAPGFDTYVTHLLTLLRLNPDEIVFHRAGEDLLYIEDKLSDRQKYETVRELFKVIETGYDATGYVPQFLGRFYLKMNSALQSELLPDIQELCNSRNPQTVGNAIETACSIATALATFDSYEKIGTIQRLCGLISQSLYSDLGGTARHVLYSAGSIVFAAHGQFGDSEKPVSAFENAAVNECFAELARNTLISFKDQGGDILCHTAPVNNIARWLSAYSTACEDPERPVAFYSGSFDPFTNGHHAIVQEIAEMGYQVYVYVHDFAPDRNLQPLLIRRKIAAMSVTDLPHVQLFPEEISINIENPQDLARLRALFPGRTVWLVAGSYRIEEDELYTQEPSEGSVHSFPHIVFMRNETHGYYDETDIRRVISGELITLKLPPYYEHMTSGEIRQNIQEGKSIEGLVAGQIQNYIRRHNLYSLSATFKPGIAELPVITEADDEKCCIYTCRDGEHSAAGKIAFHIEGAGIFLENAEVSAAPEDIYSEILLDETLLALQAEHSGVLYCPDGLFAEELLLTRGFVKGDWGGYAVSLGNPVVFFRDAELCVADTFAGDERLVQVFRENAARLQKAAALLYPGNLVLNINPKVMNYRLSGKIQEHCREICVPFGKILKSVSIPGVIMMPLYTEKCYEPDLSSFTVCEKNGYPALQTQMRNIRSMNLPFVLVDDLFHKGYRMDKISRNLESEGMKEDCVIVGVCSKAGRMLAATSRYNVDSVYEVPFLRHWIIESDMIPFFAGDKVYEAKTAIDRDIHAADTSSDFDDRFISAAPDSTQSSVRSSANRGFAEGLPSIYPIMPYQYPSFLKDAPYEVVCHLSDVCLENAISLFSTLEALYKEKFHRTLTIERLTEVITEAGYPENIFGREDLAGCTASELLKAERIRLSRLSRE